MATTTKLVAEKDSKTGKTTLVAKKVVVPSVSVAQKSAPTRAVATKAVVAPTVASIAKSVKSLLPTTQTVIRSPAAVVGIAQKLPALLTAKRPPAARPRPPAMPTRVQGPSMQKPATTSVGPIPTHVVPPSSPGVVQLDHATTTFERQVAAGDVAGATQSFANIERTLKDTAKISSNTRADQLVVNKATELVRQVNLKRVNADVQPLQKQAPADLGIAKSTVSPGAGVLSIQPPSATGTDAQAAEQAAFYNMAGQVPASYYGSGGGSSGGGGGGGGGSCPSGAASCTSAFDCPEEGATCENGCCVSPAVKEELAPAPDEEKKFPWLLVAAAAGGAYLIYRYYTKKARP